MNSKQSGRRVLAFVHIEKAAGTTLIHILRRNYFMRYCDVRPLNEGSQGLFTASDMRGTLRVNPFIRCIAGHAVKPFGDLRDRYEGIEYITLLRDPVKRYVSQFQYLTREQAHTFTFSEFLENSNYDNFQTKKITGNEDVEAAKTILSGQFLLVGIVEAFDEYLLMLRRKLQPMNFKPDYRRVNAARDKQFGMDLVKQHHDRILEKNQADLALYDYVINEIMPANRTEYGDALAGDLEQFRARRSLDYEGRIKLNLDYIVRKAYMEPVTGLIRLSRGLPAKGSY